MAGCYDRTWRVGSSNARGTRSQFRLNTQGLLPFKCTYPVHLTDMMDIGQSSQSGLPVSGQVGSPTKGTRTRTVREYEQTIAELNKENFDLKLRIYMLEEAINKTSRKDKDNSNNDQDNTIQVIVELKTESLRNELSHKNKLLQESLEQIEKKASELKELQDEYSMLKEQLSILQDAAIRAEELEAKNKMLEQDIKKRSVAIQGIVQKYRNDMLLIPKELRPSIHAAVHAAKADNKEELVTAIKSFKACLSQIMSAPVKVFGHESEEKENEAKFQVKQLKEEALKFREKLKPLEQISDLPVDLNYVEDLKSYLESKGADEKSLTVYESLQEFSRKQTSAVDEVLFGGERLIEFKGPAPTLETVTLEKSKRLLSVLKENEDLKLDIEKKINTIKDLNVVCEKYKQRSVKLQGELDEAVSKIKQLEEESLKDKVASPLSKSDAFMQTSAEWQAQLDLSDKIMTAGQSNNVEELKEEILMLLLTLEEKDKEVANVKQALSALNDHLETALNKKDVTSSDIEDFINERNELKERLVLSCSVNNELMKHLQSLETFLEDLLHQRNLDTSSLENITESSDFMSQLSRCLDESLKLSQVLSDQLSVCEGSKLLEGGELILSKADADISDSKSFSYPHLGVSRLSLSELDPSSQYIQGRNKYLSCSQEFFKNIARAGKRRWSYSSRHKFLMDKTHIESDNVVVLGTSNNEDLILLLNENGDPADVLIRNNLESNQNSVTQSSDQLRRRCWEDQCAISNALTVEKSNTHLLGNTQESSRISKQNHVWYNHYMSSDSDIWSEPDRDVSLQRIGIDVKSSPVTPRSPRKSRLRDKETSNENSSGKSSTACGIFKVHSWSRRRRSSGTATKRLFTKESIGRKDYSVEKHYSLLSEKYSKLVSLCNQLEKVREETSEPTIFIDVCDEVNNMMSSVSETMHKLAAAKEYVKSFSPIMCAKCAVAELVVKLKKSENRIQDSDVFQSVSESKAELIDSLLVELEDLKKQLEEPHAVLSSGAESSDVENELMKKAEHLDNVITLEKRKNEALQKTLSELTNQNESVKIELQKVKEVLQQEKGLLDRLKMDNLELSKQVKHLKEQLVDMEKNNSKLMTENSDIIQRLTEASKENDDLKLLTKDLEQKISNTDSLFSQLKSELEKTKEQLLEMDAKCSKYESEAHFHLQAKEECIEKLQIVETKTSTEKEELLKINEKLTSENGTLIEKLKVEQEKAELLEKEKSELNNQMIENNNEISSLQTLNKQLLDAKVVLLKEIDQLKLKLSSHSVCDNLNKDLDETKNILRQLESKCAAYEKELELGKNLSSSAKDIFIQKLINIKNEFISSMNKLKGAYKLHLNGDDIFENDEKTIDTTSVSDREQCIENLYADLILEIGRFEHIVDIVVEKLKQVKSTLSEVKSAEQNTKLKNSAIQKQLELKELEIDHLKKQMDSMQMTINHHQKGIAEKEKSLIVCECEIKSLKAQLSDLQTKFAVVENQKHLQELEINSLREQTGCVHDPGIQTLQIQLSNLQDKNADLKKQLDVKEAEMDQLREVTLKSRLSVSPYKIADSQRQELLELEISNLEKQIASLQSVIEEHQRTIIDKEKLLKSHEFEIESLKMQLSALQREIDKDKSQLNLKDDEITKLQERIFNLQSQINSILAKKIENGAKESESLMKRRHSAENSDYLDISFSLSYSKSDEKLNESLEDSIKSEICSELKSSLAQDKDSIIEQYMKKIKALKTKLSLFEKRIEILEKDKNNMRESILSQVHGKKSIGLPEEEDALTKKILDLESKLEKKNSFIKELKNDLYNSYNAFLEKQNEANALQQKLSQYEDGALKLEVQDSSPVPADIDVQIRRLRKHKWELIQTIFSLQKKFYEKKGIHLAHFDKFTNHIEKLYELQFSPLCKSDSEPSLNSSKATYSFVSSGQLSRSLLMGLELDIECLENLKIFLKRFFIPLALDDSHVPVTGADQYHSSPHTEQIAAESADKLFMSPVKEISVGDMLKAERTKIKDFSIREACAELVRMENEVVCSSPHKNRLNKFAMSISNKIDYLESVFKSLESELQYLNEVESVSEDSPSKSAGKLLVMKILHVISSVQEKMKKLFHFNESLKCLGLFARISKGLSKQDVSDQESLLSDETITLSRSESLSPVSFEEVHPVKISVIDQSEKEAERSSLKTEPVEKEKTMKDKLDAVGSSQDSVCQRSHFSSPDLGIESDPNQESSAPEQMEREDFHKEEHRMPSKQDIEIKMKQRIVVKQQLRTSFTTVDNCRRPKDIEPSFTGENLHAVGVLKDYELLKEEVKESLVGIKSVLSRTGDGLHHIATYTSPRKNLEYNTFKAIKDTCRNVEVCLKEAYKLVNNFWVAPCPSVEEWNALNQQKQEQNNKLIKLKAAIEKREKEFREAMEKLQHAQRVKENMEKKISKKLVKTKKVIRRAELKLLEKQGQNPAVVPKYVSDEPSRQENL